LPGTYNEAYKAMGDGVARSVVTALNEQLLTPLARAVVASRRASYPEREDHSKFRTSTESRAAKWAASAPR
jgi:hypothetical protein